MRMDRTFDLLDLVLAGADGNGFLHEKTDDGYRQISPADVSQRTRHIAGYLKAKGLKKNDRIILMPEAASASWVLIDLVAQSLGLVVVMVHATTTLAQLHHIVEETEAKLLVCYKAQLRVVSKSLIAMITPRVMMDSRVETPQEEEVDGTANPIDPTMLSSIIYTSGTTGEPKGVMLSHGNIMSNVQAIVLLMPLDSSQRIISYLPYSHVFERTLIYAYLAHRAHIYFIESAQHLAESLQIVRPHFFTAVPRILEKMHQQGLNHIATQRWASRKLMSWALRVSENYQPHRDRRKWLTIQFIRHILFRGFRKKLGNEVIAILVGAAHLRPQVGRVFQAAGIAVREGYGMTETSPVVTVNRFEPGLHRLGTVGLPLPGVEVRIDDPDDQGAGEIKVRGPNVMMGYFARTEETSIVLDDAGWLATGDVGIMDERGFLRITDRSKDIFKTSLGKYIAPQELANHFKDSEWVEDIFIVGFQRPYVTALILPDFERLEIWAGLNEVHWTSPKYMVHNIRIRERLQTEVENLNASLANHKKVRNFHLLPEAFSMEQNLLSNTLKPIRKSILEFYEKEIGKLYDN